ncbi:MAG: glutamine-hydrolyzing GMP synthase [Ignavibacteriae bacterium]|nr:MAG: glutamine-hydrolyzing GMP synthase [Ignavibacteriota bacterium]
MEHTQSLLVLDFGSQYTQLIARRVRELGVYSEIHPFHYSLEHIKKLHPVGIILSGGPMSVYEQDAPKPDPGLFELGIPLLGICYGLQLFADRYNGKVNSAARREYGKSDLQIDDHHDLFAGISDTTSVWMSHGDALSRLPDGFEPIAHSHNAPICAVRNQNKKMFGVQFHPEVVHTPEGKKILSNFLFTVCGATGNWSSASFIEQAEKGIRATVGSSNVLCALSGGVDSSVLAVLLHRAIGQQLHCVHINNGLMRKNESDQVVKTFRDTFHINLTYVDATETFLSRLAGVSEPEKKRKIIGKTFIDIFEEEAKKLNGPFEYLAQGTLYPDVIESVSFKGPSVTIKTHHNVGGLPEKMNFKLIEPFRELFKDEVRNIGNLLGVPSELVGRHPFPGPGLAVRILGDVTKEKLSLLREADDIFIQELKRSHLYDKIWQAFVVLLPIRSVGVMGDGRTYENAVALRAVTSVDGMTADWAQIPNDVLAHISNRITNELRGINRVVYDISSKPPATIEWE